MAMATEKLTCPHCGLTLDGGLESANQSCPRCLARSSGALSVTMSAELDAKEHHDGLLEHAIHGLKHFTERVGAASE
jgi:protein-arginine kinase activator protein McsA